MRLIVNGKPFDSASQTLAQLLEELGHGGGRIATAVNEDFVAARRRAEQRLSEGDRIEIVAPMQGG
ncbi:sulfur carrier protein ThiS [Acetobacteraceae bacterium H6797]|nr:sulfur carrier protein ThiS [Acetobacteraceae bacterium H6797]